MRFKRFGPITHSNTWEVSERMPGSGLMERVIRFPRLITHCARRVQSMRIILLDFMALPPPVL